MAIPTPVTSMGVFLMKKDTGSTYTKLIDINSFGDLGGTPETLDATTLSHYVSVSGLSLKLTTPRRNTRLLRRVRTPKQTFPFGLAVQVRTTAHTQQQVLTASSILRECTLLK